MSSTSHCGRLSSSQSTSIEGISGESLPGVLGNRRVLGVGQNRPDGPSGVDGV